MELLFIALFGAILGLAARYTSAHRHTHGVILIPAIGAAAASVAWVALIWVGMPRDGGWTWVITLAAAAATAWGVAVVLGRRRHIGDDVLLARRTRVGSPDRA